MSKDAKKSKKKGEQSKTVSMPLINPNATNNGLLF